MKKTLLIALMITALLGVFTASMVMAADAPADGLSMTAPDGSSKQPAVTFNHSTHASLKCEQCHHKMAESPDMKCDTCHADNSKENKKKPTSFYSAFHAKADGSCLGCHKSMKKGPTKCKECHVK